MRLSRPCAVLQALTAAVRAYKRKVTILLFLKEFHTAIATLQAAKKVAPEDADLEKSYQEVMSTSQQYRFTATKEQQEKRLAKAQQDPLVQALLRDPDVRSLLEAGSERGDPQKAGQCVAPLTAPCRTPLTGAGCSPSPASRTSSTFCSPAASLAWEVACEAPNALYHPTLSTDPPHPLPTRPMPLPGGALLCASPCCCCLHSPARMLQHEALQYENEWPTMPW